MLYDLNDEYTEINFMIYIVKIFQESMFILKDKFRTYEHDAL